MNKKKNTTKPKLHKDLEGFSISVNQFGEIKSTMPIEKLNEFLNEKISPVKKKTKTKNKDDSTSEK